jgi:N utilization substance protein B
MPLRTSLESLRRLLDDPELGIGKPLDTQDWEWISGLGDLVERNLPEIRRSIEEALEHWSLERLSITTRLILEQSLCEMQYLDPPTPAPVVMDEAVELARIFDSDEAAGLVNGVLDNISRKTTDSGR